MTGWIEIIREKLPKLTRWMVMLIVWMLCVTAYMIFSFTCEWKGQEMSCGSEPVQIKELK